MYKILEIVIFIISMICLVIEGCSCFQILVVGLLFEVIFSIEKIYEIKINDNKKNE